jgi:hypothetical protein
MTSAEAIFRDKNTIHPILQAPKKLIYRPGKKSLDIRMIKRLDEDYMDTNNHHGMISTENSCSLAARPHISRRVVNLNHLSDRSSARSLRQLRQNLVTDPERITDYTDTMDPQSTHNLNISSLLIRLSDKSSPFKLINSLKQRRAELDTNSFNTAQKITLAQQFDPKVEILSENSESKNLSAKEIEQKSQGRNSSKKLLMERPSFVRMNCKLADDTPRARYRGAISRPRLNSAPRSMNEPLQYLYEAGSLESKQPPKKNSIAQYNPKQGHPRTPEFFRLVDVKAPSVSQTRVGQKPPVHRLAINSLKDLLNGDRMVVMNFQEYKEQAISERWATQKGQASGSQRRSGNSGGQTDNNNNSNSSKSILVNRNRSSRDISRLNDSCSPKKKVAFAKNKMVLLFEINR